MILIWEISQFTRAKTFNLANMCCLASLWTNVRFAFIIFKTSKKPLNLCVISHGNAKQNKTLLTVSSIIKILCLLKRIQKKPFKRRSWRLSPCYSELLIFNRNTEVIFKADRWFSILFWSCVHILLAAHSAWPLNLSPLMVFRKEGMFVTHCPRPGTPCASLTHQLSEGPRVTDNSVSQAGLPQLFPRVLLPW